MFTFIRSIGFVLVLAIFISSATPVHAQFNFNIAAQIQTISEQISQLRSQLTGALLNSNVLGVSTSVLKIEAESGKLTDFTIHRNPMFSGGARLNASGPNPRAEYPFPGIDGRYLVKIIYCDEDDGAPEYSLTGSRSGTIASWRSDQTTGSTLCDTTSLTERVIAPSTTFRNNELLTLRCEQDPGEPCRVDAFTFEYLGPIESPAPTPTPTGNTFTIEAESGNLEGFSIHRNSMFSGGA